MVSFWRKHIPIDTQVSKNPFDGIVMFPFPEYGHRVHKIDFALQKE